MATPFLKRGFYGKPIGMWGPNPNRNPNYGGPWLWRAVTIQATYFHSLSGITRWVGLMAASQIDKAPPMCRVTHLHSNRMALLWGGEFQPQLFPTITEQPGPNF